MSLGNRIRRNMGAMGLLAAATLAVPLSAPAAENPPTAAEVDIGGPFRLTDQNGIERSDQDFRGAYMLIYFGYTFCPDSCPTSLLKMTGALAAFAKQDSIAAAQVMPIFISTDPARDTPAVLKDYAASFSPRLIALTGKPDAVRDVIYGYGGNFARGPGGGKDYLMDHTVFIYLMGPDGRYITHFENDVTVDDLVSALTKHIRPPTVIR